MRRIAATVLLVPALALVVLAWAAMLGLGVHRHAEAWAVSLAAAVVVVGPALAAGGFARPPRAPAVVIVAFGWCAALLLGLPIYFPGQRADAVRTGLALVGLDGTRVSNGIVGALPVEPELARAEMPVADTETTVQLPPLQLDDREIALPVEGEGRRLSVPVVIEHAGHSREVYMLLDTGATYTTLPATLLDELGVRVPPTAPEIRVSTANGPRDTRLVLVDRVWLGDLSVEGVAVSVCDECAGDEEVGLLGLNVTGGFNLTLDADRREAVFSRRAEHDRHLDVMHFASVKASLARYPGGRLEVEATLSNDGPRPILAAAAAISCRDETWTLTFDPVAPGEKTTSRRRLPAHAPCDEYTVSLRRARW